MNRCHRLFWIGLLAMPACQDHILVPPTPRPSRAETRETAVGTRKLDVVFMIDNSDSMADKQANLICSFPRFMQALQQATLGSPLDVHIGVISSDLGAGPAMAGQGCRPGGDGGAFQHAPRGKDGTCTALPRGAFIQASPAGNNFDGPIEDVFSCIAELGHAGCGFEHQLASLRRALGGDPKAPMPVENAGFLRPDARLGVVLITDEDDCSAPPDTDLFTGLDDKLTDRYGALESYRCNEFGHLCGGSPPPRRPDVTLTDCQSNETPTSKLIPVADMVAFLRTLKPAADDLVVAAITAPSAPYITQLSAPGDLSGGSERYIQIKPACMSANGTADPAVRLTQFTKQFGDKGILLNICTDDFGPVMADIARNLGEPPDLCISGRLQDSDPRAPGVQPDCAVTLQPVTVEPASATVIPACDHNGGQPPCWAVQANPAHCPAPASAQSMEVTINWGPAPPTALTRIHTSCAVCTGDRC